jgi:hypothetical protein
VVVEKVKAALNPQQKMALLILAAEAVAVTTPAKVEMVDLEL